MNRRLPRPVRFLSLALAPLALAQVAPPASPAAGDPVTLSPFEVSVGRDSGYVATSSLAGSRLNTELRDTPAAISVFTKELLDDLGVLSTFSALEFALNASREFTDYTGLSSVQQGDGNIQVRGFTGASLGRD